MYRRLFSIFFIILVFLVSCEKTKQNISISLSGFVAREPLNFPNGLSRKDPLDELGDKGFRWAQAQLYVSKKCMEASVKSRKEASRRQTKLKGIKWAQNIKEIFMNKSALQFYEQDSKIAKYVSIVGNRVKDARSDIKYDGDFDFFVYETESDSFKFNAFALPGGNVLIHDQLVLAMNESELAFILGHEIAHIEWASYDKELIILFGDWEELSDILSNLKNIAISICQGPMDEAFIDFWGVIYSRAAGYDPVAAAQLFLNQLYDGLDLGDYSILNTHPPSVVRASYAYFAANDKIKRTIDWDACAYFRGKRGSLSPWNGKIPLTVKLWFSIF